MPLPHLLLDIDGVLIPFPAADGSTPHTHRCHDVLPAGRATDDPVTVWLNPAHGPLIRGLLETGLAAPAWCTSWRQDAPRLIGPLLGLPAFPHLDLPRLPITTSHPNGYLWKRDYVDSGSETPRPPGSTTTSPPSTTNGRPAAPQQECRLCSSSQIPDKGCTQLTCERSSSGPTGRNPGTVGLHDLA